MADTGGRAFVALPESAQVIDVALDAYPFSAAAAACDALSMGVPVVTWSGESRASRVTASVLNTAGSGQTVAADADGYVKTAVDLAHVGVRSLEQRRDLRGGVAGSALCDEARFVRKLEDAYRRMWRQFCEG